MLVLQDTQSSSVRKGFLEVALAGFEGGMRKGIVGRMFKRMKPESRLWHLGETKFNMARS